MKKNKYLITIVSILFFAACGGKGERTGKEYAPNMYHPIPYEPLTQIDDKEAGTWLDSRDDGKGEFFNSNPFNPDSMNMREPAPHSVKRTSGKFIYYNLPRDSTGSTFYLDRAAQSLKSPLDTSQIILNEGKTLYTRYCSHCHGQNGQGDGAVGLVMKGVPSYSTGRIKTATEGHIFYVISNGKGRMMPHNTQIDVMDRWRIVRYVQALQNQNP